MCYLNWCVRGTTSLHIKQLKVTKSSQETGDKHWEFTQFWKNRLILVKNARQKQSPSTVPTIPLLSRWHCFSIHYPCISSSLIRLFVGRIAVLLKTEWGGGSFVSQLMMSLCERAGREGWGHWCRLWRVVVWVLVWLAAAVIRSLCLQPGPTELPWQGPMFQTPPDSPDGLSDTVGEGGRTTESIVIGREWES